MCFATLPVVRQFMCVLACSDSVQERVKQKLALFKSTAAAQQGELQHKEAHAALLRQQAADAAAATEAVAAAAAAARDKVVKQRLQVHIAPILLQF